MELEEFVVFLSLLFVSGSVLFSNECITCSWIYRLRELEDL